MFSRHFEEARQLFDKKVAILGIGAIGSILGMTLLQSGIENLYIVDQDYVDLENISRSVYIESNIGIKKTEAFKRCASLKDGDYGHRVIESGSLEEVIQLNPDLLIVCIGSLYDEYIISHQIRRSGFDKAVFVFGQNDSTWGGIYFQDDPQLMPSRKLLTPLGA